MKNTSNTITIKEFFNDYYKQQAQNANYQKIASYIDGLKPTQRKVIYTVIKGNITQWTKVEGLANKTSDGTQYLGGASNISGVITNISKNFVGTNNLPLLETQGNFGQRLDTKPGEPRYIKVRKHKDTEKYFKKIDTNVLIEQIFEEEIIEPRFYLPTLPILFLNGSEGIGSGHAQSFLPRKKEDLICYIKDVLNNKKPKEVLPYWNGFKGDVIKLQHNKFATLGKFTVNKRKIKITELPIGYNLNSYLKVLDTLEDKKIIKSYKDLSNTKTDTFEFEVTIDTKFNLDKNNIINKLSLSKTYTENYTSIDENNSIRLFKTYEEVLNAYIKIKLEYYQKRKDYIINKIKEDIELNSSRYIFVYNVTKDKIIVNNTKKADIIKQIQNEPKIIKVDDTYDYLLRMPIYSLTNEKLKELKAKILKLKEDLKNIKSKDVKDIWLDEIKQIEDE